MRRITKATVKMLLYLMITVCFFIKSYSQFNYIPSKADHISAAEYRAGTYVLINSYNQIKAAKNGIVAIDYWNIAIGYSMLGQSKDTIYYFLLRSKEINESDFCSLVLSSIKISGGIENTRFYKTLGESYRKVANYCMEEVKAMKEDTTTIIRPGTNKALIYKLRKMATLDQTARNDMAIQRPIDLQLIQEVEAIIEQYGYPGRSLVGEEYEGIAWIVIQHADLSYQEKYLPIIHRAVIDHQLSEIPLKMLIDRIYTKKTGFQIFGSQGGVDFADDKVIEDVKKEYSLN